MYFVYRYVNGEDLVYVGITNNLKARRQQHSINSKWYNEKLKYEFIKVDNKYIAKNFEEYLINRDRPINNKAENNKYDVSKIKFNIEENWEIFICEKHTKITPKKNIIKNKRRTFDEEFEYSCDIYDNIFYNYKDKIIKITYSHPYDEFSVVFDSFEVKELHRKATLMPLHISSVKGSYNDNIIIISVSKNRNCNREMSNPKFNELFEMLKVNSI